MKIFKMIKAVRDNKKIFVMRIKLVKKKISKFAIIISFKNKEWRVVSPQIDIKII